MNETDTINLTDIELKKQYLLAYDKYINSVKGKYEKNFGARLSDIGKKHYKNNILNNIFSEANAETYSGSKSESKIEHNYLSIEHNYLSIEQKNELKSIYHDLAIKYHPDKNTTTSEVFIKINDCYSQNNLDALKIFKTCSEKDNFELFDIYVYVDELEKKIKNVTDTVYWKWNEGGSILKSYYESLFLTDDEQKIFLEEHNEKLKTEIDRLTDINKFLKN
jgi:hypothetical protein